MKTSIGDKILLNSVPKLIKINSSFYILSKNSDNTPILFNADCPHQHGIVEELCDDSWRCPNHNWTFNPKNGKCINAPQSKLESFPVIIENTKLFANLPRSKKIISTNSDIVKTNPTIKLISNACMLIQWNGKNILTDPWIIGPAIYGAWVHYPPIKFDIKDLPKIDFVLISHEHSDHFNEKTLSLLDKDIPVYFPNYKMDRLEKRIRKLGFSNIFSAQSEKITDLTDDIKLIFFNSNSMWNDSIIYLQLGNFKILNVNDAGFNWNIPKLIGNVDLVCSAFSFGASAYPLNWRHLDESEKIEIMKTKNLGMLKMLKQITNMCNPKYLLPFANFNELGPIRLRKFAKMQIKNTPNTVKKFFQNDNTIVLEMFPGESWDGKTEKITKRQDHEQLFDRNKVIKFLETNYHSETDQQFIPKKFTIEHIMIKKYFEDFSNSEISKTVGTYSVILRSFNEKRELIGKIPSESLTSERWAFVFDDEKEIYSKLTAIPNTLDDISDRISVGLQTSADKIYIVTFKEETDSLVKVFSNELDDHILLEKNILRKFVKGSKDIHPNEITYSDRLVIFPYKKTKDGFKVYDKNEMEKLFPKCFQYLQKYEAKLKRRADCPRRDWWGYTYPRNLDIFEKIKIMTPFNAFYPSFSFDDVGYCYTTGIAGGYGIIIKSEYEIEPKYLIGLLNSVLLGRYMISKGGAGLQGGYTSYEDRFIKNIPIVLPDEKNQTEVKQISDLVESIEKLKDSGVNSDELSTQIVEKMAQIDFLVFKLYNISSDEKEIILKYSEMTKMYQGSTESYKKILEEKR